MINTDNVVVLSGRLTRDPETIMDGKKLRFSIAVDNSGYDRDNPDNRAGFFECSAWLTSSPLNPEAFASDLNSMLEQDRLVKGSAVRIVGSLHFSRGTDKNGNSRNYVEVDVQSLTSYTAKSKSSSSQPQAQAASASASAASNDYAGEEPF